MSESKSGHFSIIISDVKQETLEDVVNEFVRIFAIEPVTAKKILAQVPICILYDLSSQQAVKVLDILTGLKMLGCVVQAEVYGASVNKRLKWSINPTLEGQHLKDLGKPSESKRLHACPSCGAKIAIDVAAGTIENIAPPAKPKAAPSGGGSAAKDKPESAPEQPAANPKPKTEDKRPQKKPAPPTPGKISEKGSAPLYDMGNTLAGDGNINVVGDLSDFEHGLMDFPIDEEDPT